MKKKSTFFMVALLFVIGLSLLLYPFVSNQWNNYRQKKLISTYDQVVSENVDTIDYEAEWQKAHAYNDALLPSILPDSFAIAAAQEEDDASYEASLNLAGDGMMGYVEIPKINIKIPIFHGTSEEVLQKAAGHLEGSSLPVGGANTHAVISAHRGLPSASLFTDLDQLTEGDHFLLYILDDILCYQVDQIDIVEPEQTDALAVVEGEDLVTLLTCTPYGVNSHRMLVRGHRVAYIPEVVDEETGNLLTGTSLHTNYLLWVIIGLSVTGIFILFLYRKERHRIAKMQALQANPEDEAIEMMDESAEALDESTETDAPQSEYVEETTPETFETETTQAQSQDNQKPEKKYKKRRRKKKHSKLK